MIDETHPPAEHEEPWHTFSPEDCLRKTDSRSQGLSEGEAAKRLERDGPNKLPEGRRLTPLQRFLLQFHNILIYVLIVAAIITVFLGHWIDAGVIAAVVVINAFIGFIQEGKAEKALDAIRGMLSVHATVTRAGERREINAEKLVVGDIVHLQSGDKVPADIRLLDVRSLRIEEAALTGESVPVEKSAEAVSQGLPLGDRTCMAYSGTLITYGQARGVVVGTGARTELGRINAMLAAAPALTTPLLVQIGRFGRGLTVAIVLLGALTFLLGYFVQDYPFNDIFLAVVGLAVAAIPEGLPAIITITLAIGVQAMARRNAIIRRLPAVETLGSVSVICSDKTGTLTRNEMTVRSVVTGDHFYDVGGVGWEPTGTFTRELETIAPLENPVLAELLRAGLLCNDSRLRESNGSWSVEGDPTEGALIAAAAKAGLTRADEEKRSPRIDSIPFESEHKYMATLHQSSEGNIIYLKGAPERILERCRSQWTDASEETPLTPSDWENHMENVASRGERLLGIAFRRVGSDVRRIEHEDVGEGFVFLGVTGLIDPPRDEAIAAIKQCHQAGIDVKMITGDHALTASAIGRQIGLRGGDRVVTGEELERTSDQDLVALADEVGVFARTSPEHKLRLVKALQARGRIVAMTGDGVNDAPALKTANVGVAMGIKGTEAAKEAAEMVLTDDNFASIANAVEEGRTVYDNIKKSILFILPTNWAQAMIIIVAILFGLTLPITPVQILWVNMITATTLALSLAFEPAERNVMRRPPRNPRESILPPFFLWRIGFVSLIIMFGSLLMFEWKIQQDAPLEEARTAAINTLILGQVFYLLNSRFIRDSSFRRDVLTNNAYVSYAIALILLAQILFTYLPAMQTLFGTGPIAGVSWIPMILIGVIVFVLVEGEKALIRAWSNRRNR